MKRFFSVFKTVFLSLGVIVGAGFISGKEPVTYFGEENNLVNCLLFGLVFSASLSVCLFKDEETRFPFGALFADFIVCASLLSAIDSLSVFLGVNCGIPLFSLSVLIASPLITNGGIGRLERFNVFFMLLPVMVLVAAFVGTSGKSAPTFQIKLNNFGIFPLTFCNLYLALPVLKTSVENKSAKFKILVSAFVGLALSAMLFVVMSLCAKQGASNFDLPLMLFVENKYSNAVAVSLVVATLSSVFSLYYPLRECSVSLGGKWGVPLLTLSLFAFSRLGVSNIIGYCYPLIGVLGFMQTAKRLMKLVKKSRYKKISKENNNVKRQTKKEKPYVKKETQKQSG